MIAYPNEELPAGRPAQDDAELRRAAGGGRALRRRLGHGDAAVLRAPASRSSSSSRRCGARTPTAFVAAEVAATRSAAGLLDTGVYARYEVTGPGAEAWLDRLLANRLPPLGRMRLAPMLSPAGRLMGDLTVTRLAADRFWLVGSYYLQEWHLRWFRDHLPPSGVQVENLSESWLGFSLSGPRSREILARLDARGRVGRGAAVPRLPAARRRPRPRRSSRACR